MGNRYHVISVSIETFGIYSNVHTKLIESILFENLVAAGFQNLREKIIDNYVDDLRRINRHE